MNRRRRTVDFIPLTGQYLVHTFGGLIVPPHRARRWRDDVQLTEWLGGYPITVTRVRTEQWVPVPFSPRDWEQLEDMLGGAS